MALLDKRTQLFLAVIFFCTLACIPMLTIVEANEVTTTKPNETHHKKATSKSVKKDLTAIKQAPPIESPQAPPELHDAAPAAPPQQQEKVNPLNDKSATEKKAALTSPVEKTQKEMEQLKEGSQQAESNLFPVETQQHVEEDKFTVKDDFELPDSYRAGFYFFFAVSSIGVAIVLVKLYRMRLTRAERRYGVQGDRSTQELTPLPIAIEDTNSDEDDHTLFEVNREQIRIL